MLVIAEELRAALRRYNDGRWRGLLSLLFPMDRITALR